MKNNQKITVTKPFMPPKEEYIKMIDKIWDNKWITNNGPILIDFKENLKKYLNVDNICMTVNGHMALDVAIKSLKISGEVITTPFTFASTTHVLTLNGITPVFCDIREKDLNIDPNKIEDLITDKTSAIMPVHVYGHICDIDKIEKIAKKYNLKVIYDAAHCFGISKNNISVANCGDASIFSFHATKVFNSIEGGCVIFKDKNLERLFNAYINFGIEGPEEMNFIGGNSKMNEFQAAMGLINLKYIDEAISYRKELTLYYRTLLSKIKGIKYFEPEKMNNYTYNYSYFPILIDCNITGFTRDELYNYLNKLHIGTRKYFYPLITDFECYKKNYKNIKLPIAHKISEMILCLPLYNDLTKKDIDYICENIAFLEKEKN